VTDFCYRIDDFYGPDEDITVSFNDPDLGVEWPAPITIVSDRDRNGISWSQFKEVIGAD
jgi:dTDP-4-dehydrorhamnose 3,5-epimerase